MSLKVRNWFFKISWWWNQLSLKRFLPSFSNWRSLKLGNGLLKYKWLQNWVILKLFLKLKLKRSLNEVFNLEETKHDHKALHDSKTHKFRLLITVNSLNGLDRSWCFSLAMWLTRTIYWLETRQAHLSNREEKQSSWEISVPKPQSRIQAGSLYPSDQGRLGTEFFRQAWQVTSHPKSPRMTGNEAAKTLNKKVKISQKV